MKKEFVIIFIIMITEVLGFSLILPFLPLFAKDFGATPLTIGFILMSFSLFQFITSPILGKMSDRYGRKPLLLFSQLSTLISFLILGFANSIWMIFLSRIVDGMLGSNMTIAKAYLTDISKKKNRSKVFGLVGAAFGFGLMIGPAMGGYLSSISSMSYRLPSFVAAIVSFLTIILTMFFLKETVKKNKKVRLELKILPFESIIKFLSDKKVSLKLYQQFGFILSHSVFVSTFALFAQMQYGLDVKAIGFLLMYIGVISVIIRGILLGKIIDIFGEKNLQFYGSILIIVGLSSMAFSTYKFMIYSGISLFVFGIGVVGPILNGEISRKVSAKEQGEVIGVSSSLRSISDIFGPLIGGFVINYFWIGNLAIIAAMISFISFLLIIKENSDRLLIR